MKRLAVSGIIAGYLLILSFGLFSQVTGYRTYDRLEMYFIVWDMYCGWDAYETRRHLVAEGESGAYYELSPAPWGEFVPFGSASRGDLDYMGNYSGHVARNVLNHTEHEPIARVYLVDECWLKKYNLPESLWKQRYEQPRERMSYFYLRGIYLPEGDIFQIEPDWKNFLANEALSNNPRLQAEAVSNQPFLPQLGNSAPQSPVRTPDFLLPAAAKAVARSQ